MEVNLTTLSRASKVSLRGYGPVVNYSEVSGLNTITYQLIKSFVLVQLLVSNRFKVDDPKVDYPISSSSTVKDITANPSIIAQDSEELIQSAMKCLLSIASDRALTDAVLQGQFPDYRVALEFVGGQYGISLRGLTSQYMGKDFISEIDSAIKKQPLIKRTENYINVSYAGVSVNIGFNKHRTIDGFVYDVSTSVNGIKDGCNKSKIVISAFLEEIEKIKKEENAVFVFSDSSSTKTFSKLEGYVKFVDLGVPSSKNPRTNNHIKIRFL